MYFWKCWRDNRLRFIVYLSLLAGVAALIALIQIHSASGWWRLPSGSDSKFIRRSWELTSRFNLGWLGSLLTIFAGLGLGASGPGEEVTQGTSEFLLTRPRPRNYFVWVGWAMAVAELFVILCMTVLTTFAILIFITRSIYTWRFLSVLVPLFILGTVVLSLTYFMTTVARSARVGLVLSLGLVLLGLIGPAGFRAWSKTDIPSPMDLMSATEWIINYSTGSFHFRLMAAWSLVALAFPVAAQLIFERAEV